MLDLPFGDISGRIFVSDDNSRIALLNRARASYEIYEPIDVNTSSQGTLLVQIRGGDLRNLQAMSGDGRYAFVTDNKENIDPDRYSVDDPGTAERYRVAFAIDVDNDRLQPLDVFEGSTVILGGNSYPLASDNDVVYFASYRPSMGKGEVQDDWVIYAHDLASGLVVDEYIPPDSSCGVPNNSSYSQERGTLVYPCNGTIYEMTPDGVFTTTVPDRPVTLFSTFVEGNKIWGTAFGDVVRIGGYSVELDTGVTELLTPEGSEGDLFSVTDDFRYVLYYTLDSVTGDDVDTVDPGYDSYVCRAGEGASSCVLLEPDVVETGFEISWHIFEPGDRIFGSQSIVDNPLYVPAATAAAAPD